MTNLQVFQRLMRHAWEAGVGEQFHAHYKRLRRAGIEELRAARAALREAIGPDAPMPNIPEPPPVVVRIEREGHA